MESERGATVLPVDDERSFRARRRGELEGVGLVGPEGQVDVEGVEARQALNAAEAHHARPLGERRRFDLEDIEHGLVLCARAESERCCLFY